MMCIRSVPTSRRWWARPLRSATCRRAKTSTSSRCSATAPTPQRKAIEDCPPGAVLVMDSRKDARAASAGAILVTRLKQRGVAGIVTDGGFRDSAEIAKLGFPAYHHRPSAPTNLTLHQAIEINCPIGCGDAPVFPGDVILGDSDGVIVIPAHLADEIADETFEMTAFEDFVTEEVGRGRGIFGLYPATDEQTLKDFAAWRKKMGRGDKSTSPRTSEPTGRANARPMTGSASAIRDP